MNLIDMSQSQTGKFGKTWVENTKNEIGVDLMGVLEVNEGSHPHLLQGVKAFMPSAKAAIVLALEYFFGNHEPP